MKMKKRAAMFLHKGHLRAGFRGGLSLREECKTKTVKLT